MEALIHIAFVPSFDTGYVSPSVPQYAGVQGDKNTAYVSFAVPEELCGENYRYHMECIDGCGARCVSPLLPIDTQHCVGMLLDRDITAAGGQALIRLVVTQEIGGSEVTVARSFEGRLYFTDSVIPSPEEIRKATERGTMFNLRDGANVGAVHGVNATGTEMGVNAVALGQATQATGENSLTAGYRSQATGQQATAFGNETTAEGFASHSEGDHTVASETATHAEGTRTRACAENAHAEGSFAYAEGESSHAEGGFTAAVGSYSHAEGFLSRAEGNYSHAAGQNTVAVGEAQTAVGRYNAADANALFAVGNGTDDTHRHTAFSVQRDGAVKMGDCTLQEVLHGLPDGVHIVWDGETEGRESFLPDEHPTLYRCLFCKVGDVLPTDEQLCGGAYSYVDKTGENTVTRPITADMLSEGTNCIVIDRSIIVAYSTDICLSYMGIPDAVPLTVPSSGIYFSDAAQSGNAGAVTELSYGTSSVKEYVDRQDRTLREYVDSKVKNTGSTTWRLLRDDTLSETTGVYLADTDADGNAFHCKKMKVEIYADTTNSTYPSSGNFVIDLCRFNNGSHWARVGYLSNPMPTTAGRASYICVDYEMFDQRVFVTYSAHKNIDGFAYSQMGDPANAGFSRSPAWPIERDTVDMLRFSYSGEGGFHTGTRFVVWGVDA